MMVEQAGDCIGFLGFLLYQYVGPCLLVKIYVPEKNVHCNQPLLSVKLLKRGANSVAPDHEAASNLPPIAFTNLHLISSSMQKRADQLHNNNNDFAFATQI